MHKVGLINKWLTDTLPKKDKCWSSTQFEVINHKVNLDDMQGSFIVLLMGEFFYTDIKITMFYLCSFFYFRCVIVTGIICV